MHAFVTTVVLNDDGYASIQDACFTCGRPVMESRDFLSQSGVLSQDCLEA